ncbi:MAG TPA: hypothetical protein VE998_06015, partial [Terriglobales bacterium]|nr:hypothetical protein [Terriglobales bacterium]
MMAAGHLPAASALAVLLAISALANINGQIGAPLQNQLRSDQWRNRQNAMVALNRRHSSQSTTALADLLQYEEGVL